MLSIAQLADAMDEARVVRCNRCDALRFCASWIRCDGCGHPFEEAVSGEDDAEGEDDADTTIEDDTADDDGCDGDSMVGTALDDTPSHTHGHAHEDEPTKRKARRGEGRRSGTEKLVERPDLTRANTESRVYLPQKRIAGSVPVLVKVDKERQRKIAELSMVEGYGQDTAGREACMAEFTCLLLGAGFSEGSWKHAAGCDRECQRTCKGSCKKDGNVYTYPRYQGLYFDEGVFNTRRDFFRRDARARALEFARAKGQTRAQASKKWNAVDETGTLVLTDAQRQALHVKLAGDIMHGYTNYVALVEAAEAAIKATGAPSPGAPSPRRRTPGP